MAFDKEKLMRKILEFTVLFWCIHLFNMVTGKSVISIDTVIYVLLLKDSGDLQYISKRLFHLLEVQFCFLVRLAWAT